ncbi:AraC family transcriptional regulator [Microbacteriaceae bacterium VKM Ac-2854]|nr:AraC family transcriptional regulator [Microbacteriaceae bacterium VKM Ac-2854]
MSRQLSGPRGLIELGPGYGSLQPDAMRIRMESRRVGRVGLHALAATRLTFEPIAFGAPDIMLCFYVTRGAVHVDTPDRRTFSAGTVFFATGVSRARFAITHPSTVVVIVLSAAVLNAAGIEPPDDHGPLSADSALVAATLTLANAFTGSDIDTTEIAERHLARAIEELSVGVFLQSAGFRRADEPVSIDARAAALDVIEQRYIDPELTPSSVATALNVSVRHLQRAFQAGEETVSAAIRDRRTRAAVDILTDKHAAALSLPDVAARSGFGTVGEMRRAVSTVTGLSPRALRTSAAEQPFPSEVPSRT